MSTPEDLETIRKKYPKRLTRGRAIKLYCKENCCAGDTNNWQKCSQPACFLFNYRLGRETMGNEITPSKNNSVLPKFRKRGA
jgi:hypothetical protein